MKLKYKFLFFILILFMFLFIHNNKVNAYYFDPVAFEEFCENNSDLSEFLSDKTYLITYWENWNCVICVYTDNFCEFSVSGSFGSNASSSVVLSSSNEQELKYFYLFDGLNRSDFFIGSTENFLKNSTNNRIYCRSLYNFLYSNTNCYYNSEKITNLKNLNFINDFKLTSINFTTNNLLDPLTLETNMFNFENVSNYDLYVSFNDVNNFLKVGNKATFTNVQENKNYFYFTYSPEFGNGIYYFRLFNKLTNEWSNTVTFNFVGVDFDSTVDSSVEVPDFYIKKENNSFILQTQWLDINKRDYYDLYFSKKNDFFINCDGDNLSTLTYTDENNITYFRYEYVIYYEGTYFFKFINYENTENILSSEVVQVNLYFDSNYDDTLISQPDYENIPSLDYTLSYENYNEVVIYSQWFDISLINCYNLYLYDNISNWVNSYAEIEQNDTAFRFKYTATENRVYHFRIYKNVGDISFHSSTVSITITLIDSVSYVDFVKNKLFKLYEDSFGFLTYPFTLFFDICNRFMNIEFSEPVINIPDIYIPLFESEKPLISETSINFSTIIEENSTFKIIHNLILICTDAFIIFGLVNLFFKKWNEVFK